MRTTAFIAFVATSFMLFICTSALVINKSQGESSVQFDRGFASGRERRGMPKIQVRRDPGDQSVSQCERIGKCKPRLPDNH